MLRPRDMENINLDLVYINKLLEVLKGATIPFQILCATYTNINFKFAMLGY